MENINGLETAKEIRKKDYSVPIVYVTNYVDYWKKAYDVHAFQFILKPLKDNEIVKTLCDFYKIYQINKIKDNRKIKLNLIDGFITVYLKDILYFYIEKKRNVTMCTKNGSYNVKENLSDIYEKLKNIEEKLKDEDGSFFCTHRCCILNMEYIDRIENKYDIIMTNGDFLPLSQRRYNEFMYRLSERFEQTLKCR